MMDLFHGSLEVVQQPRILTPTRTLDYGGGFYTTTSADQAEKWVRRKLTQECPQGYVNRYKVDIDEVRGKLNVLCFDHTDGEWLDFVMANRTDRHFQHDYDVVYGPVANDKVYAAFALYVEDYQTSALDALRYLYRTPLYRQLEQEETKLWHRGPVALYEEAVDLTM